MIENLLTVEGLTLEFITRRGRVKALENISLKVNIGEIVAIVGESGSGKSVLSYAIMGLLDAAADIRGGSIHFKDIDLLSSKKKLAQMRGRDLSMIFQNPRSALNPIRKVGHQIEDVLIRHSPISRSQARSEAIAILRTVRIPDPERRYFAYPFELSGGMCQRIMIAMALSCRPALLVADEPTTGLDVTTQAILLDFVRKSVDDTKMAAILITHDLTLAGEYCDRVVVMHAGHVVESAPTDMIFSDPKHPYTRLLLGATPTENRRLDELEAIPGNLPDLRQDLPLCRFRDRCVRAEPDCDALPLPVTNIAPEHNVRCHHPV